MAGRRMSVQQMMLSVQMGEFGKAEPEPEPEQEPTGGNARSRGGSAGKAVARRMRRVSVALLGGDRSGNEEASGPSHKVTADDDKQNLQRLMGLDTDAQASVAPTKKKMGRMRRLSVNLMGKIASKSKALADSPGSRSGPSEEDEYDPVRGSTATNARAGSANTSRAGSAGTSRTDSPGTSRPDSAGTSRPDSAGTSRPHSAATSRSTHCGGSRDDDSQSGSSGEQEIKTKLKRGGSFVQRMRRMSVEAVGKVATKAVEHLLEDTAEAGQQQEQLAQEQLEAQRLAEQADRRMRAEMRRKHEEEEAAERKARAAEREALRARIAEEAARELAKEKGNQEQILREVQRQRREKEQRELTLRSMGKMAKTREAAMDLYMQALEHGGQLLDSGQQRRPGSAVSAGGSSTIHSIIGGHWTVEAPAAVTCEMKDALDEVKLMAHQVSPVKYGGVTRDRLVIIAIGGAACSGKSWLGLRLAHSAHQGGLEALLLSLDTFTKTATGAVQSTNTVPLHPFLDASSLMPAGHSSGSLDTLATYDLAFARRCMQQLRRDLAAELPARAVSSEQGEGGTGMTTARVPPSKVVVIEGRFALHPMLADVVDIRVHCGGSPHAMLLRSIARRAERKLSLASSEGWEGCPALGALQALASSTLPMAALYSSRIASCADLLVRNDWSPLGDVPKDSDEAGTMGEHVRDMGGHTIYGVTVNRGNTSADFNRVAKWIYGIARTASGRCISLDGPTHLLDYDWLVKSPGTAVPKHHRTTVASAAAVHASVNPRSIGTATESMRGASRGGISIGSRETHSAGSRSSATTTTSSAVAARCAGGSLPMSAKAEQRARERSRKRNDPKCRPWRTKAQPLVSQEHESDESDDETVTSAGHASTYSTRRKKKPLPPWPEDGTLPPAAHVVEAIGMPPRDALDPSGESSRVGVDGLPRFWFRVSDRAGQYRVVACERPKGKQKNPSNRATGETQQQQAERDQSSTVDSESNHEGEKSHSKNDEPGQEESERQGNVSSPSHWKSKHRRSNNGHGSRTHRDESRESAGADARETTSRRRKKKGRSSASHASGKSLQEQHRMEQNSEGNENGKGSDSKSVNQGPPADKSEDASATRRFKLPFTGATVPAGVASWNEVALGGEAEGGTVLSQLLSIGYYIDTVHTVQSHSFLVPCFARAAGGQSDEPSAAFGVDRPVHAAGGSVLVIVERRTVLGGPGCHATKFSSSNSKSKAESDGQAAVTVRIEGTDPVEVERVSRLITLGTLAAKKLRGVDTDNVSALNGFADVSNRPTTASSANLPWLNPWRDNDTPSNSRPASGASNRSQQHGHHEDAPEQCGSRPASGNSTGSSSTQNRSKRSTGGGYGAGGLVALPVNRSLDINRSQRRVRSREGRHPGGKHGEYWRTNGTHKGQEKNGTNSVPVLHNSVDESTSGMAAVAAARLVDAGQHSSSEEDDFDE